MPAQQKDHLSVEVAFALPQQQLIVPLKVMPGTTAVQAIEQSGILIKFPQIDLNQTQIGIFGKVVKPETPLRALDRVEIYRPLIADAKEVRRQRAAEGKVTKKGGGEMEG